MLLSLLRIVLILLIIRALWKLFRGVMEGVSQTRVGGAAPPGVTLVRDPICGVFVAPSSALIARTGGETMYFCSEKCRDAWGRR